MFRRRRPLLRAAAVGGGAYMAGKHMARKQDDQYAAESDQDQRISDLESQQQAAVRAGRARGGARRPAQPRSIS